MKKGIVLSFIAVLLIGVLVFVFWEISEKGKYSSYTRDTFIPYNSAMVITIYPDTKISEKVHDAFQSQISEFRNNLLFKVTDTLLQAKISSSTPRTLAIRVEGKNKPVHLYVIENKEGISKNEIRTFWKSIFNEQNEEGRKYDRFRIYTLKCHNQQIYYAIEGGVILLADSELYIEDALNQSENDVEGGKFKDVNRYFSSGADFNVFLNTEYFSDLAALWIDRKKVFKDIDIPNSFKWGALDGNINKDNIILNGFLQYGAIKGSFLKSIQSQSPKDSKIENIVPYNTESFFSLNLSDLNEYFTSLESFRHDVGIGDKVKKRKQEVLRGLGKEAENELNELIQGEFTKANISFNFNTGKHENVVIVNLKSGSLGKEWINKVIENYARLNNRTKESFQQIYKIDRDKSFPYYQFPYEDIPALFWGEIFEEGSSKYLFIEDNFLFMASSPKVVEEVVKSLTRRNFIKDAEWYKKLKSSLPAKYNMAYYAAFMSELPFYNFITRNDYKSLFTLDRSIVPAFSSLGFLWANEGNDMLYSTFVARSDELESVSKPYQVWETKLDAPLTSKPVVVKNHITGEREFFIQDDNNTIYLVNDGGRILWKQVLEEKINSEVYQVDMFKNNRLQYLFSTSSKIYLIDRNGNMVERFPITLKAKCKTGITVYDYENNKDYRIFAPSADNQVYLYDKQGTLVKGWDFKKTDNEIVSKVYHFRIDGKDYLVVADKYRIYMVDRRGVERIKVSTVFDLADNTELFLIKNNKKNVIAFPDKLGKINIVDFSGKVSSLECEDITPDSYINILDIDRDSNDDFVIAYENKLSVYNHTGKKIYNLNLEVESLSYPYVYRFSNQDIRVGMVDNERKQMLLVNPQKGMSQGFPIAGESPFSIVFAENGVFYLFAGTNNGSFIKYRVQN